MIHSMIHPAISMRVPSRCNSLPRVKGKIIEGYGGVMGSGYRVKVQAAGSNRILDLPDRFVPGGVENWMNGSGFIDVIPTGINRGNHINRASGTRMQICCAADFMLVAENLFERISRRNELAMVYAEKLPISWAGIKVAEGDEAFEVCSSEINLGGATYIPKAVAAFPKTSINLLADPNMRKYFRFIPEGVNNPWDVVLSLANVGVEKSGLLPAEIIIREVTEKK